ncbi:scarecrow-like protein 8 [Brassica rapa]|uniref:Scarecrow-like protein 8 n=2 Tax=Brassica TaxID=3705 RepID=A0ABQ8E856_BRANA|nr:scarecrow-like protein 8 [Brassica rapa]XP_048610111.1 scarecrow-like protein 8 [Brassica napus]XP_048610114.1 scarecrow-like protein 8 [Brassica napus]XP_048610116.1 scarecrow-like protein 8 [Brassica napus]XP_048610119.1 scarecrow-like protein 8 [Brassica napus]XP_048610120.1 scarecrow-like protein 8 [Brassica napus]KAH0937834.1 hypothetical protein HID58_005295 [Brassica napus]
MVSGFPSGGGDGRSTPGGFGTVVNNNPQPTYRSQSPGIFLDQTGNRFSGGKRTLADFQAAQQQQAAVNAFLLRSVKPRTFQNLQSPTIGLTSVNDMGLFGGSSQTQHQTDLVGIRMGYGSSIEPVQNLNRVEDSKNMLSSSLRELEKQLLEDDDESDAQGGGDDVSTITHSNSDWLHRVLTPVLSSSPSSASSPSTTCSRQTVMEIAAAVAEGKTEIAAELLACVSPTPNQKTNSEERLVNFMVTALRLRINPAEKESRAPPSPATATELYGKEHLISTQLLYELSPCFKLGFMAANLAILDAAGDNHDGGGVLMHVVDFEIGDGGQYVNLLHALSTRRSGDDKPLVVKITAVTNHGGERRLKAVGDRLSQLGDRLGVSLRFKVVASLRLGDISRESLGCGPDEPLAVNLAFKLYRVPDESVCMENPRDALLRRVKGLEPRVVTLVEQEMNSNTAPFLGRVSEACACYGALLDSVESSVASSNLDRAKVEEGIGRKLINAVACEGIDRIERCEVFGKWRMRMSMAGFELMPVSEKIAESMKSRLGNGNIVHSGFTVKEDDGGVCFGWMGRTLAVASAWR